MDTFLATWHPCGPWCTSESTVNVWSHGASIHPLKRCSRPQISHSYFIIYNTPCSGELNTKWAAKAEGSASLSVYGKLSPEVILIYHVFLSFAWFNCDFAMAQNLSIVQYEKRKTGSFYIFVLSPNSTKCMAALVLFLLTREILQCHLFPGCFDKLHHHRKFSFSSSINLLKKNAWFIWLSSPLPPSLLYLLLLPPLLHCVCFV